MSSLIYYQFKSDPKLKMLFFDGSKMPKSEFISLVAKEENIDLTYSKILVFDFENIEIKEKNYQIASFSYLKLERRNVDHYVRKPKLQMLNTVKKNFEKFEPVMKPICHNTGDTKGKDAFLDVLGDMDMAITIQDKCYNMDNPHARMRKKVHPKFTCYKCRAVGKHNIDQCPGFKDKYGNFVDRRLFKTGERVMKKDLIETTPDDVNAILDDTGTYYKLKESNIVKHQKAPKIPVEEIVKEVRHIPEEFICGLCFQLISDANKTPCCATNYCYKCIINKLFDAEVCGDHLCPNCKSEINLMSDLIPNEELNNSIFLWKSQTGPETATINPIPQLELCQNSNVDKPNSESSCSVQKDKKKDEADSTSFKKNPFQGNKKYPISQYQRKPQYNQYKPKYQGYQGYSKFPPKNALKLNNQFKLDNTVHPENRQAPIVSENRFKLENAPPAPRNRQVSIENPNKCQQSTTPSCAKDSTTLFQRLLNDPEKMIEAQQYIFTQPEIMVDIRKCNNDPQKVMEVMNKHLCDENLHKHPQLQAMDKSFAKQREDFTDRNEQRTPRRIIRKSRSFEGKRKSRSIESKRKSSSSSRSRSSCNRKSRSRSRLSSNRDRITENKTRTVCATPNQQSKCKRRSKSLEEPPVKKSKLSNSQSKTSCKRSKSRSGSRCSNANTRKTIKRSGSKCSNASTRKSITKSKGRGSKPPQERRSQSVIGDNSKVDTKLCPSYDGQDKDVREINSRDINEDVCQQDFNRYKNKFNKKFETGTCKDDYQGGRDRWENNKNPKFEQRNQYRGGNQKKIDDDRRPNFEQRNQYRGGNQKRFDDNTRPYFEQRNQERFGNDRNSKFEQRNQFRGGNQERFGNDRNPNFEQRNQYRGGNQERFGNDRHQNFEQRDQFRGGNQERFNNDRNSKFEQRNQFRGGNNERCRTAFEDDRRRNFKRRDQDRFQQDDKNEKTPNYCPNQNRIQDKCDKETYNNDGKGNINRKRSLQPNKKPCSELEETKKFCSENAWNKREEDKNTCKNKPNAQESCQKSAKKNGKSCASSKTTNQPLVLPEDIEELNEMDPLFDDNYMNDDDIFGNNCCSQYKTEEPVAITCKKQEEKIELFEKKKPIVKKELDLVSENILSPKLDNLKNKNRIKRKSRSLSLRKRKMPKHKNSKSQKTFF